MSSSEFGAYQQAIVGTTFEGYQRIGFYFPIKEYSIAEALPQPAQVIFGEGKSRYNGVGVSRLTGVGKRRDIPHEVLVLATRVDVTGLPKSADGHNGALKALVDSMRWEFSRAGVGLTLRESGEDIGKTAVIAVHMPLTPEAFAAGRQIAQQLRGPANQLTLAA